MILIVTPTLGRCKFLDETVASVERYGPEGHRHVIVCPTEMVGELAARYPSKEILAEQPKFGQGLYAAVNSVMLSSQGWSGFTYINDDDMLDQGFQMSAHVFKVNPTLDVVYGDVGVHFEERRLPFNLTLCRSPRLLPFVWASRHPGMYQQGAIVRKELLDRLNGFRSELRLVADTDLFRRAYLMGANFRYVKGVSAQFRFRTGQLSSDSASMKLEAERVFKLGRLSHRVFGSLLWRIYGFPELIRRATLTGRLTTRGLFKKIK